MSKHTPGPWEEYQRDASWHVGKLGDSDKAPQIADISFDDPDAEANARLIAAAPDLLNAVRFASQWIQDLIGDEVDDDPEYHEAMETLYSAVGKATGE